MRQSGSVVKTRWLRARTYLVQRKRKSGSARVMVNGGGNAESEIEGEEFWLGAGASWALKKSSGRRLAKSCRAPSA